MMTCTDPVLTRQEVAERLRVSLRTLTRMEKRGQMPPRIKISDRIYGYLDSAVRGYLAARTVGE